MTATPETGRAAAFLHACSEDRYPVLAYVFPAAMFLLSVLLLRPFGEFPMNDDWVYSRDVLDTLRKGAYSISGFEFAWGIPQVLLGVLAAKIFGFSLFLMRSIGILSILAAGYFLHALLLPLKPPFVVRGLAIASFFFFAPLYAASASFLTDSLFLCLWLWTCFAAERAFTGQKVWWRFIFCAVAAFATITQRQFGAILPITGILAAGIWLFRRKGGPISGALLAFGASLACAAAVAFWWTGHLSGSQPPILPQFDPKTFVRYLHTSLLYLGLFSLPLLFFQKTGGRRTLACAAFFILVLALIAARKFYPHGEWMPYLGNQISKYGLFRIEEVMMGLRPENIGRNAGVFFTAACIAGTASLALASRSLRLFFRREYAWGGFTVLASAIYLVCVNARGCVFDRYLLPLLPGALMLWAAGPLVLSRRRSALGACMVLAVMVFSWTIMSDHFRRMEAAWGEADRLVQQGVGRGRIHAGYEWNGFYGNTSGHPIDNLAGKEYVVSFSPGFRSQEFSRSFTVMTSVPYRSSWPPRSRKLYVLRRTAVAQPAGEAPEGLHRTIPGDRENEP